MTSHFPMVCGLDIETSGLNKEKDHITEIGWVIKRFRNLKPLAVKSYFVLGAPEIPKEVFQVTKISMAILEKAGIPACDVYNYLMQDLIKYGVEYIIAHNGDRFDKPFMEVYGERFDIGNASKVISETTWLDTMTDIVYPPDIRNRDLIGIGACLGFCNPFPHAAVFDAFSTLKVAEHFDIKDMIRRHYEPWVTVRALVIPPYSDPAPNGEKETDKAKARKYRWQDCGDGKIRDKCWVKRVKRSEIEQEAREAPFKVVELKDGDE